MRKYIVTEEDMLEHETNGGHCRATELPPNARVLTREEVWEVLISLKRTSVSVGAAHEILDSIFGEKP